MTLILDLPGDVERELEAEATRLGLPVAEYAVQLLAENLPSNEAPQITNGAELIAFWEREGVIGSRPEIRDPAEHARRIRAQAERRRAS
jgi:hypothetical protein